jgi:hypothetical protein
MKIKVRQGLASGNDLAFPGYCLKKSLQFSLTFNDDSSAPLLHQRHVPDELNGIPQALFGVEQNAAPFQPAPIPWRPSEVSR